MSQKTRAAITTEINTTLADNTTRSITPAILRTVVQDITDSSGNPLTDGASVLATTQVYTVGDSIIALAALQARLLADLGGASAGWNVVNLGVAGDGLTNIANRIPLLIGSDAKSIIVVEGGINDIVGGATGAQTITRLQTAYTAAHAIAVVTGAKVVGVTITPAAGSAGWTGAMETARTTVNAHAGLFTGVDYTYDAATALQDPSDHTKLLAAYDSGDHLHPSTAGAQVYADGIFAIVPTWTKAAGSYQVGASSAVGPLNQSVSTTSDVSFNSVTAGPSNLHSSPFRWKVGGALPATPVAGCEDLSVDGNTRYYVDAGGVRRSYLLDSQKGVANGVAILDSNALLDISQATALVGARSVRESLYFDGTTSGQVCAWPLGTVGNLAGSPWCTPVSFWNDGTSASVVRGIWSLSSSASAWAASSVSLYRSSNNLVLELSGATPGTDYRRLTYTNFFTAFPVGPTFIHTDWPTTGAPTVYANGAALTMVEASGGTAPAWTSTIASGYFLAGVRAATERWNSRIVPFGPINGVWTAAEIREHVQSGRMPHWSALTSGSVVASYTVDTSVAAPTGWSVVRGTRTGNIDAVSDGSTSYDDNLRFYADGSANSHYLYDAPDPTRFEQGKRYRFSGYYYIPAAQTNVDGVNVYDDSGHSILIGTFSVVGTWTPFSFEFTHTADLLTFFPTHAGNIVFTGANSASDDRFYLHAMTMTTIAPLFKPQILGTGSTMVIDGSSNSIIGTFTSGVTPIGYPIPTVGANAFSMTGDVTLTLKSLRVQWPTPTANRIFTLPVAGGYPGDMFEFNNRVAATYTITVQKSDATVLRVLSPQTGTIAAWDGSVWFIK